MATVRMAGGEGKLAFRTNFMDCTISVSTIAEGSAMSECHLVIVFALFPGATQLDFTAPHQVLSRLPGATVILASPQGGTIEADGVVFAGLRRLADIPA